MLPDPPGAKQCSLTVCKSIHRCSWKHLKLWRCIQNATKLTIRIVKFWSSWVRYTDLQETSRSTETPAKLCGSLREQLRLPCTTAGEMVLSFESSGSYTTTGHFVISYSSLLLSQDSLHNMPCINNVDLYMYIQSIWQQMVVKHDQRSTWTFPLSDHRDAPLRCHCSEQIELERQEPTINTPLHLAWHPNNINEKERFRFEEHSNRVRRYDATQLRRPTQLRWFMKS